MATTTHVKHSKLDHVEINQGLTVVHPDPDQARTPSNEDFTVDIVAVPGLGASPIWTWRSQNKVDWLRDSNMLPRSITNARIMVFEYESQWFGKGSINQRLASVADSLVQSLSYQRPKGSKRPILFVCHCLGGIIVEKALLNAQLRQKDYPNVFMSVVGCIFLGTPFRGTKSQSKATLLANMAEAVGLGVNSGLLRMLEEGSETLKDLLSDFSTVARESNMQIFCFFEQHASDMIKLVYKGPHPKHKELIVEEDSAHIDGYRTGALAADHFGLNKFTGPKDGRYVAVAGEIRATVQRAAGILKSRQNAIRQTLVDDATYQTILDKLKITDPQKDLLDSVKGRPASQASWALSNENYIKWHEACNSKILWIHGNAGKGQPVIASSIMQHLEEQSKNADGVFLAYFFCDEKDSRRRNMQDVLKLLIRQLIWKNRDLTEHLLAGDGKGKKNDYDSLETASLASLWRSLQNMLGDASVEKVYFIVNAFDETDKDSRKEFLPLLETYLAPPPKDQNDDETAVKWIFLSRSGRPDIEKSLTKALVICMEDKENAGFVNDGVKREISGQVDELAQHKGFNNALTYLIKRYVYAKADGNYIYAHLVVQELKNLDPSQSNISTIRKFLEDLPYGLTDMFEFVRRRVLNPKSEGIEYTKEILRCLILAIESPTFFELALIADLPPEVHNDQEALLKYIRRCGAFLTTTTNENGYEIVEWIDVVAKEHLLTYGKEELSLNLNDVQHGIMALRCLEHVRSVFAVESTPSNVEDPRSKEENPETNAVQEDISETHSQVSDNLEGVNDIADIDNGAIRTGDNTEDRAVNTLPLQISPQAEGTDDAGSEQSEASEQWEPYLYYAVHYWMRHALQAPIDVVEEFDLRDTFWDEDSVVRAAWWSKYSADSRHTGVTGITPLHLAAMFGYMALLDHLLEHGRTNELHTADSSGATPLVWACDYGDISLVDRLLKAGADVNHESEVGDRSALWVAASCSHTELVPYLIEHGAKVNWQSADAGTPLYVAASICNMEIFLELLQHNADVNQKGGAHIRPLNVAAYFGYTEILRVLLEHGTEVDPDDEYSYGSALGAAARSGHLEIVRLLLQKGWNSNPKMKTYNSPLVAAATYGHAEVVQVLLEHGAEGASQLQALNIASKNGQTDVVKNLLAATPYLPHQKAFHNAATYGRDDILELLEKRGTNAEMLDTALYDASDQERESTVNSLLKLGANPNSEGKEYGNALQAAAWDGSIGIVKSLLAYGADVNKQGGDYGTALQAAATQGHEDIIRMLLDHGAQVNTESSGRYGSALQAACGSQNSDVVELLIGHGADVNSPGGEYGSAIMAAADEEMQINLEILVKNGANVNVKDVRDEHPPLLVQAGYTLGKESLELLLDHGAEIEGADDDGTTVLISVADSGDKESLEMLLQRGANIRAVSTTLGTALSAAASEGDEECLRVLLDHGGDTNQHCANWGTALQAAADAADLDCINMLLEAGADVNQMGGSYGYALQASASSGDIECMRRLLEAGANVNLVGGESGSALAEAAGMGNLDCVNLLLEHGIEVNLQGGIYECALQAGCARQDNYECVKILLDHGADTHLDGGLYGSVIQAAAVGQNLSLWDLLLEHGAAVDTLGGKYGHALQAAALKADQAFVRKLLEHQVHVDEISGKYATALQAAASSGNVEVVRLLLEHNANPRTEGGFYGSALNAAARRGIIDVLNVLLEQGLPYHMIDGALVQAVLSRQDEAVEKLIKNGASVEAMDAENRSPFDLLQNPAELDANSDFGNDEEDDYESEASFEEDDDVESVTADAADGPDDASVAAGTDDGASIANLQLEDPSTADAKIQKYLEEAKSKIRRNPTLRRPFAVQRKPVAATQGNGQIPASTAQYDAFGISKPQQPEHADSGYHHSGDNWQRKSQEDNAYAYHPASYNQPTSAIPTNIEYTAYSSHLPAHQGYSSYQDQPPINVSGGISYEASSRPAHEASPYQTQPQYFSPPSQPPPPSLPTSSSYTGGIPANSSTWPANPYNSPNANADRPPPTPPRPQPQPTNSTYQAYRQQNLQQRPSLYEAQQQSFSSSSYQTQTQQHPYHQSPPLSLQQYPPSGSAPSYGAYQSPAQQYQAQYPPSLSTPPPPLQQPPRPSLAQTQSQGSDGLDFGALQQKAQRFGSSVGRFGK